MNAIVNQKNETAQSAAARLQKLPTIERLMVEYLAVSQITTTQKNSKENQELEPEELPHKFLDWRPLAFQIRMSPSDIEALWEHIGPTRQQELWALTIQHRAETIVALPGIQHNTKARVVNKAVMRIEALLDANLVRDVSELLAIAKVLGGTPSPTPHGQQPTLNNTFNYNIGGVPTMQLKDGETLPDGKDTMFIDLSPGTAANLSKARPAIVDRVIDAEMLGVESLRSMTFQETNEKD